MTLFFNYSPRRVNDMQTCRLTCRHAAGHADMRDMRIAMQIDKQGHAGCMSLTCSGHPPACQAACRACRACQFGVHLKSCMSMTCSLHVICMAACQAACHACQPHNFYFNACQAACPACHACHACQPHVPHVRTQPCCMGQRGARIPACPCTPIRPSSTCIRSEAQTLSKHQVSPKNITC
jgi:hypothetical protein